MTTILRVNLNDLNSQFFQDLNQKFDASAKVEIRLQGKKPHTEIFSDVQFWQVIDQLDWSKKKAADILAPASAFLAALPIAVVAEGKEYYEQVLKDPSKLSSEISFEPLLRLTDHT